MLQSLRCLYALALAAVLMVTAPAPVHADAEIVIGAVLTLGDDEDGAGYQVLVGLQRAVDALNGLGGVEVAGEFQTVRLEVFDDKGSDRRALALARVLIVRRDATVVIAGSRPSAGLAITPIGDEFRIPMIDVVGLPAAQAPGGAPFRFSMLPSLEDRWMPALTLAVLVRRMQGTQSDLVPLGLIADDPILYETALRVAGAWGMTPASDASANGDSVILLLDDPDQWREDRDLGGGIVIVPNCADAGLLRQQRPVGAILCTTLWQDDTPAQSTEASIAAETAVLAVAQAVERGRTGYGPVLRDILMLLNAETPVGTLRFGADGRNIGLATRLYSVESDGLYEIDPADPSSLWQDTP